MAQPTVKLQAYIPGTGLLDPSYFDVLIWDNIYFNPVSSPYTAYDGWCADNDTEIDLFYLALGEIQWVPPVHLAAHRGNEKSNFPQRK